MWLIVAFLVFLLGFVYSWTERNILRNFYQSRARILILGMLLKISKLNVRNWLLKLLEFIESGGEWPVAKESKIHTVEGRKYVEIFYHLRGEEWTLYLPFCAKEARKKTKFVAIKGTEEKVLKLHPGILLDLQPAWVNADRVEKRERKTVSFASS